MLKESCTAKTVLNQKNVLIGNYLEQTMYNQRIEKMRTKSGTYKTK